MSSLDTLYPINLSTPADVILEPYTNVPGNVEVNLGFVPRAFKGGTDFKIYTDSVGVTQLTESVDYELTVIDEYYTEQAEFDVYISFKIINPTHYNKNFWITSKVLGSYVDAAYHESISQEGLFRNAIVDPGFLLWDAGTSFTNPTDGAYTANMWIAERSGASPDQYILSRDTATEDTHNPYICKIQVTSAGTGTKASSVYQKIDNYEKFKDQPVTVRARVNFPNGSNGNLFIDNGNETFQKDFTGIGSEQDVVFENQAFTTVMTYFKVHVRFSDSSINATVDNYYVLELQVFASQTTIPFEQKKEADIVKQASYYYERIFTSGSHRIRSTQYSSNNLQFDLIMNPKKSDGTLSIGGVESTDWNVTLTGGTVQTPFSIISLSGKKDGSVSFIARKITHGLTDALFLFKGASNSYIEHDARL